MNGHKLKKENVLSNIINTALRKRRGFVDYTPVCNRTSSVDKYRAIFYSSAECSWLSQEHIFLAVTFLPFLKVFWKREKIFELMSSGSYAGARIFVEIAGRGGEQDAANGKEKYQPKREIAS